ncbi:zinc finger, CCHC-type containing protein [Tanacetum coccineum]
MGDENPIRTLGDYSKPSHEGYRNTIELPVGNNVDFLKLVDSLDLDGENRERTRLRLFQFSLRDQASNWLERLPAGSISTWEDLTTRFLAQFFPPGRTAKLRNDILMFQQHHGESLSEAWTRFKDLLQKVPHHGIDLWLQVQIFYDHVNPVTRRTIDQSAGGPAPQLQALGTTFKARVRDYKTAHTERMERFENTIFKQRKEINGGMTEIFGLLKELTTSRTPKKHKINGKLIKGLVKNNRFNNSLSGTRVRNKNGKAYKVLPGGPVYDAILKKKITKKEDIGGNFKIPCSIGDLKHVNALIDQGSDVNVMPYFTYMKLTNKRSAETDIRLSLASHSYIYPLGITKDVLVEVVEHVFPVDFVILNIKENEKRPFILGTLFLTTAKAIIKFDIGTISLRSGKTSARMGRKNKTLVFGRPFIKEIGLVYNEEEGAVMFKQDDEKIIFKMPHTMKIFKQARLMGLSTDSIPPSAYEENFVHGRTHYYQSLLIGDEYKQDDGDRRRIRHLMRLEKEMMDNKEEVM